METQRWSLSAAMSLAAFCWMMAPPVSQAAPISEALTINPIDVCDTMGNNCAVNPTNTAYFTNLQAIMDAAWAQAGIAPVLLPVQTLDIGTVTTSAGRYGLITDVNTT